MSAPENELPQKKLGELCGLRGWQAQYEDLVPEAHWADISSLRGEVGRPEKSVFPRTCLSARASLTAFGCLWTCLARPRNLRSVVGCLLSAPLTHRDWQEVTRHPLYRTKRCHRHDQLWHMGGCPRRFECYFAHTEEELRPVPEEVDQHYSFRLRLVDGENKQLFACENDLMRQDKTG